MSNKHSLMNWTFNYYVPTEIVFGCGEVSRLGELASQFGTKALLVTGPNSNSRKPIYDKVKENLLSSGVEVFHFDGVVPNPTTECVSAGAQMAKENKVQLIIGLGGGSSMDAAKAIAVEAVHEGSAWDYLFYKEKPTDKTLPIIAISTTAGTGSQATSIAVITNSQLKDKSALSNRRLFPKISIVDPELTATMPVGVTAQTGFDAFCHNFEALISVRSNPMVEALSLDAISRTYKYLPLAVKDGSNMEARSQMAWVDTLGGITNTGAGTTLPHGLAMQIGGHCPHVSHGQALASIYPSFTRYTRPSAVEKFAAVARAIDPSLNNVDDETASLKCCEFIDELLKNIGLWVNLKDFNLSKEDIDEIAKDGQVLGDYKRNPRVATLKEMHEILTESYDRA